MRVSTLKGWFKVLGVNFLFLAAAVVAIELVAGRWNADSGLGQLKILRNISKNYRLDGLYPWPTERIKYTRDAYGLRGQFTNPAAIELLTVGGSTTDQKFIPDGFTWQDMLGEEFVKRGRSITIGNAGVDGQSSVGHLRCFSDWFPHVPGLKPKWILFYVGINDLFLENGRIFSDAISTEGDGWAVKFRNSLAQKSALFSIGRTIEGILLIRGNQVAIPTKFDEKAVQLVGEDIFTGHEKFQTLLRDYRVRLLQLVHSTQRLGAQPIFATQAKASVFRKDSRLYEFKNSEGASDYYRLAALNRITLEVCAEMNLTCFDLASELSFDLTDFYDYMHTNPTGNRKNALYFRDNFLRSPDFAPPGERAPAQ